jgi:DNA-binding SARP family transcriptional activator
MELREPFPSGTNIHRSERGLLRVAVLGPPEVVRDGSRLTFPLRKAQALLLYLTVEGGMHSRSKLAALLWPDSEAHTARTALRNALTLLRNLLDGSLVAHSPLISQQDALGLNPQAPLELDLEVVLQAWKEAQWLSTTPVGTQRASLVVQLQHALSLARGPFLDDFQLGGEIPFDGWVQQQQRQWQIRLRLLCDRLSSWQEAGGELEQAQATLVRWLALDPLSEEAYRRLMRVHLALGDATAALQVYATCRSRLAQELQVEPSADTIKQATYIRTTAARLSGNRSARPFSAGSQAPDALIAPLVGRTSAFTKLVECYQQVRLGQPQTVLLAGEAGIGKTRLANEWMAWVRAQGADVLSGHALELGTRLSYQPLVEALQSRLKEENAPEDLLEDLWLAELSRIFPELRVRYPDLVAPTCDPLTDRLRLFEAVARFLDALARQVPLVLFLDDLHWMDEASLDLVRYLGRYWKEHGSRVLLLGTVCCEGQKLNPQLLAQLLDLKCDLPITLITLQPLSQEETHHLVKAIVGEEKYGGRSGGEWVPAEFSSDGAGPMLGDWLFVHTRGQPFYLLETLKLFRDWGWLVPQLRVNGTWRLKLVVEMTTIVTQKQVGREMVPPSVRAMILARLSKLSQPARQLVMASAVLGSQVSVHLLWQVTGLGVQAGIEALEEAVKSGMLHEEAAIEPGADRLGSYGFSYELVREVVYTELAQRQILRQRTLARLQVGGVRTSQELVSLSLRD